MSIIDKPTVDGRVERDRRYHNSGLRHVPRHEERVTIPGRWIRPLRGGRKSWHRVVAAHAFEDVGVDGQPVKGVIVTTLCGQKWRVAYVEFSMDAEAPGPLHLTCERYLAQGS